MSRSGPVSARPSRRRGSASWAFSILKVQRVDAGGQLRNRSQGHWRLGIEVDVDSEVGALEAGILRQVDHHARCRVFYPQAHESVGSTAIFRTCPAEGLIKDLSLGSSGSSYPEGPTAAAAVATATMLRA